MKQKTIITAGLGIVARLNLPQQHLAELTSIEEVMSHICNQKPKGDKFNK